MPGFRIGIAAKLILISAALLIVVVGLFGLFNNIQSRRIIDEHSRIQREILVNGLRETGRSELRLLSRAIRVALLQNDYGTLRAIVHEFAGQDRRITGLAVVDAPGTIIAHSDESLVGNRASGPLRMAVASDKPGEQQDVMVRGERSVAFHYPVVEGETHVCTVFLAYSLRPLTAALQQAEQLKRREVRSSIRNVLIVGALSLLLGFVLTIIQGVRLSRPIHALASQAKRMAEGDLGARVSLTSRDEIGMLAHRFNYMAERIAALVQETRAKAALQMELEVARAVQQTLVPAQHVVDVGGLSLAGHFEPAAACGGDWWTFAEIDGGRVLVIIGDVTGHGVASAMITAAAKGAATMITTLTRGRISLGEMLAALNAAILDAAKGSFAMTCAAAIFDPRTGTLTHANAGHTCPYLWRSSGNELTSLSLIGDRLGDSIDSRYEVKEVKLQAGDVVVWYTDGLVEVENDSGESFGDHRLQKAIRHSARETPQTVVQDIVDAGRTFYGERPLPDDITLVVGRVIGG